MDKIVIKGGNKLTGEVKVEGAKNAVLPILTASLLASDKPSKLVNVPALSDVETINNVLTTLNADVTYKKDENAVVVDATKTLNEEAPYEYVSKMRASILVMGPLLARLGHAIVALPGGCAIGSRPIEQHIKGFEALGAEIHLENGNIYANAKDGLKGTSIHLDFPSVGATQNIIMAASLAKGKTLIENAAKEPEIVDLANYINEMGGRITGAGTDTITINGVESLHGVEHAIIPDRIEAGTYMCIAAACGENVILNNIVPKHVETLTAKFSELGVNVDVRDERIRINNNAPYQFVDIKTLVYPGFATDLQQPITPLLFMANGPSFVTDTIYPERFKHVEELKRMGANIEVDEGTATIKPSTLHGAEVYASDLRAGACLIIAGLIAEGVTTIYNVKHIYRGYTDIVEHLKALGADIWTETV
ncbi:UDP-N-acetylglucosamine 1-carboxyvinyltransferase [Staphylococcus aureus]|nr:UDP-N-acetylglucosamine 1-carboxyvinyltransferase [Staphylococcus aureus]ORN82454.1 UDP-N-acetylglucosamine 1-carboxyvinyltransferase [Staphylococcus aureus]